MVFLFFFSFSVHKTAPNSRSNVKFFLFAQKSLIVVLFIKKTFLVLQHCKSSNCLNKHMICIISKKYYSEMHNFLLIFNFWPSKIIYSLHRQYIKLTYLLKWWTLAFLKLTEWEHHLTFTSTKLSKEGIRVNHRSVLSSFWYWNQRRWVGSGFFILYKKTT